MLYSSAEKHYHFRFMTYHISILVYRLGFFSYVTNVRKPAGRSLRQGDALGGGVYSAAADCCC